MTGMTEFGPISRRVALECDCHTTCNRNDSPTFPRIAQNTEHKTKGTEHTCVQVLMGNSVISIFDAFDSSSRTEISPLIM